MEIIATNKYGAHKQAVYNRKMQYTHFLISIMMLSKRLWDFRFFVSITNSGFLESDAYFGGYLQKYTK